MRIYISGKMRGLPEEESRRKFEAARQYLIELGHDVVNPWDSEKDKEEQCLKWEDYILYDLKIIKGCDALFMLDNWQDSDGAKCEHAFARGIGMEIIYEEQPEKTYTLIWQNIREIDHILRNLRNENRTFGFPNGFYAEALERFIRGKE